MSRINKIDFFSGAFLSYLISNGVKEPTLFEATEKSKIIKFSLRNKDYNVYLKYVSTSKQSIQKGKKYTKWDIIFTKKENEILQTTFKEIDKENIIVLVCTNENFEDTYLAVIPLYDAITCLGTDNINNQHRITIKHQKKSTYALCYGTALSDKNGFKIKYNFNEYFEF